MNRCKKKHCFKYNVNVVCGLLIEYLHIFTWMNCVKKLWPNLVTMEYLKTMPFWRVLADVLHRYAMFYFNIPTSDTCLLCSYHVLISRKQNRKVDDFCLRHTMSQSQGNEMKKKLDYLSPKLVLYNTLGFSKSVVYYWNL